MLLLPPKYLAISIFPRALEGVSSLLFDKAARFIFKKIMLIFKQVKTKVSQKWLKGIVQPKTYSGSCYPKIHSFLHGRKNKIFIRMSKLLVFSIQWKHTAVVDIHFHYMETSSLDSAKYNYQTVKLWNVVLRCLILYCGLFRHHY